MNRLEYLAHHGNPEEIVNEVMLEISAWRKSTDILKSDLAERDAEIARLREENSKLKSEILEHDLVECECNDGTCGICELNKALEAGR